MKRELTLTDIAGYLDHTLLGQHLTGAICWIDVKFIAQHGIALARYNPVLRPMSDLYVEISERGYNNGKPFVPLVEFAKVRYPYLTSRRFITDTKYVECAENDSSGWGKWKMYELELESMSVDELDLLHRLHLDYRDLIDAGLAVSVHDLKQNPYE
ncbi:hypothetical protein [Alistipes onderdonkii]|jgi:hypothetical protein|uniref:hypothetical protein n=1 Tax=Alistipes onderdonkii TaxID=328813 RepID=UPI0034A5362C